VSSQEEFAADKARIAALRRTRNGVRRSQYPRARSASAPYPRL